MKQCILYTYHSLFNLRAEPQSPMSDFTEESNEFTLSLKDADPETLKSILEIHWDRICSRLKIEVGEVEYRTWLQQITLGGIEEDELTLYLPTRFLRDWVRSQYNSKLNQLWNSELSQIRRVELALTIPSANSEDSPTKTEVTQENHIASPSNRTNKDSTQPIQERSVPITDNKEDEGSKLPLQTQLDPRFTFDNFIVGKPNEFAYACSRRVAERPSSPGFNPLFLYGGVGLGKTHLMHAIGFELAQAGNISVSYMSAEKFMYRFIASIRSQSTIEFKEELRSVDVLMIDDLQFLIGKDNTQEEFFHTFNALIDAGRQIIVSADKSPSDLSGLEDRLRTRLGCGMVADIHATTYELRISILEAKAASAKVVISPKVLEFLAHKITTNVRELEGALNRLIAHANLFGRPITLEATQEVLHDILKSHERRVTIEEIQRKVSEHCNIRQTDMTSARRARAVARPRQIAMYLAKQLTSRSLPEIGRKFGNRDHTTVMHAISRISELIEKDSAFAEDVELLRRMLES
ncbi:Chromosomal replication initiation ATPase DnaA (DnaA) (PDB:1L8Q) [Commensalibacter papalotli (ex Botero et al. 2024)]|uniref:Chromosomal replication initiator protein DnaA n=2 Tax=Commensalibacter papalotli (ex Botero et al. 2024) TaxID=2972766 RepID=A0ABM9HHZ6_9PROT|nr:Chromosomal replication initiation ATPase DnaA (DnaA) (PDB:1L8Q) [Commensalibacter papalotli (ex Botero et al. 2024)]CAI3928733.1 Chromosomal replication initiation ATPase DnaA (DnaA) (PDB:1L8Q) [Commensalibacter papalotli (ex Botero et al. 2024)]